MSNLSTGCNLERLWIKMKIYALAFPVASPITRARQASTYVSYTLHRYLQKSAVLYPDANCNKYVSYLFPFPKSELRSSVTVARQRLYFLRENK